MVSVLQSNGFQDLKEFSAYDCDFLSMISVFCPWKIVAIYTVSKASEHGPAYRKRICLNCTADVIVIIIPQAP